MEALELRDIPATLEANGLLGQYFHDKNFAEVGAVRVDADVNFNWVTGSSASGIAVDKFAARWTGTVTAPVSGTLTFLTRSDDGVRVWVDDQQLINNWTDHSLKEDNGTISLVAGQSYSLRMEYYENSGSAQASLLWQLPGTTAKVPIPNSALAPAAVTVPVEGSGTGLLAQYFGSKTLTDLGAIRVDATIDNNWAGGSPDANVPINNFSARWTGQVEPRYTGNYTFTTTSDDGVRLWVNNQLIVDQWNDHSVKDHKGVIALAAGERYDIEMEYYENGGNAVAKLWWASDNFQVREIVPMGQLYPGSVPAAVEGNGTGLLGEYFNQPNLTGLALRRQDAAVNFSWGTGSPESRLPADRFSVRWTGEVMPRYGGAYTFYTTSDDGVRLWIDGQLIIDQWNDHSAREHKGQIHLLAGQKYDLRLEYYEKSGSATAKLAWSSDYQRKEFIPASQLTPKVYADEFSGRVQSGQVLEGRLQAPNFPNATFEKVSDPSRGSLTIRPDGTFTFRSPDDHLGTVSFQFVARNGNDVSPPTPGTIQVEYARMVVYLDFSDLAIEVPQELPATENPFNLTPEDRAAFLALNQAKSLAFVLSEGRRSRGGRRAWPSGGGLGELRVGVRHRGLSFWSADRCVVAADRSIRTPASRETS